MLNIRVYKVTFPDGKIAYESKSSDDRGAVGFSNIRSLAENVKFEVQGHFDNNDHLSQVTIDLFPFHEIECPSGLASRLCSRLSEEEKMDFWNYYKS